MENVAEAGGSMFGETAPARPRRERFKSRMGTIKKPGFPRGEAGPEVARFYR